MKIERPQYEIWLQKPGELGIYQQIERAGRVCYKSENNTTNDSAKPFVDRMIQSEHYAMLEHGTVYLVCNHGELPLYTSNKFSRCHTIDGKTYVYTKLGNTVHQKPVTVLWTDGEDTLISMEYVKDENELEMYDEVIVEGTGLYNGKLL